MNLARLSSAPRSELRIEHCSDDEYVAFLDRLSVTPSFRRKRRFYRAEFVECWPQLEDWLAEPLHERIGRLSGEKQKAPSYPTSYRAHSYLFYLALTDRLRFDYDWLLAIGDLAVGPVAGPLGVDFGIPRLVAEGIRHTYQPASLAGSLRWALSRIALHTGVREPEKLGSVHIEELLAAIDEYGEVRDLGGFRSAGMSSLKRDWFINARLLQTLLYHRGQVADLPTLPSRRRPLLPPQQPAMHAAVERWLALRRLELTGETVDHLAVSLRHFLKHLALVAPKVDSFAKLSREHAVSFVQEMAETPRIATGRSLSIYARRARIAAVTRFFEDAIAWGWPDMPNRPLLDRRDMPRPPARIPRFIPADELAKLMEAVKALSCPYQRAALLIARWSGARRGEISRLSIDCLDCYPDGTARLRIPAGKTMKERMVPLHEEAAEGLRAVMTMRSGGPERPLVDARTGTAVQYLFLRRGKPMSMNYLFDYPLRAACKAAGLVDAAGRATVTAHRFRHTVGTQLAERGAKLHTIMSVLGHESPHMSMVYARISDAEVLRDYRSVLEPGAIIAGAGAEAIRSGALSAGAVDWLRSHFLKTELELGHCLRLPAEGPCECDLYLSCSRFVTTPVYVPRLRERRELELKLAHDARERAWPREVERHCGVARRIERLLADLGAPIETSGESAEVR